MWGLILRRSQKPIYGRVGVHTAMKAGVVGDDHRSLRLGLDLNQEHIGDLRRRGTTRSRAKRPWAIGFALAKLEGVTVGSSGERV